MTEMETSQIEEFICAHPLVCHCVIVGESQPYYSVLLSPDKARLEQQLNADYPSREHRLDSYHRLNDIDVRRYFCDVLEAANAKLKNKRVERFVLLELATEKSRAAICAENRPIIDSFYQEYIPGIG